MLFDSTRIHLPQGKGKAEHIWQRHKEAGTRSRVRAGAGQGVLKIPALGLASAIPAEPAGRGPLLDALPRDAGAGS